MCSGFGCWWIFPFICFGFMFLVMFLGGRNRKGSWCCFSRGSQSNRDRIIKLEEEIRSLKENNRITGD